MITDLENIHLLAHLLFYGKGKKKYCSAIKRNAFANLSWSGYYQEVWWGDGAEIELSVHITTFESTFRPFFIFLHS